MWLGQGAEEEEPQMSSHILLIVCVEESLPELVSVEPFGLQEHLKVEGCYAGDVVAVVPGLNHISDASVGVSFSVWILLNL